MEQFRQKCVEPSSKIIVSNKCDGFGVISSIWKKFFLLVLNWAKTTQYPQKKYPEEKDPSGYRSVLVSNANGQLIIQTL
jgi:hypothetical protein